MLIIHDEVPFSLMTQSNIEVNCMFQGGGKACTSLHVARTICRRAERCVVTLVRNGEVDKEAQVYLNRLVLLYLLYNSVLPL